MEVKIKSINAYNYDEKSEGKGSTVQTDKFSASIGGIYDNALVISGNDLQRRSSGKRSKITRHAVCIELTKADLKIIFDAALKAKLITMPGIAEIDAARKSLEAAAEKLGITK